MVAGPNTAATPARRRHADERSAGHRRLGRPRDSALDAAILEVAERQLLERGFAGTSIAAVAREAGTTVPSLRRRYHDKPALVAAVIDSIRVAALPERTGSPRDLALAVLENFGRNLRRPHSMALLGTLLAEEHRQPDLIGRFRKRMVDPRRRLLRDALVAGEQDRRVDVDVAVSMLIGSFYAAYISNGEIPTGWPGRVLEQVWPESATREAGR